MRSGRKNRSITHPQADLVHHRAAIPLNITLLIDFGFTRALSIIELEEWRTARRENFPFFLHPQNRAILKTGGIHGKTGPSSPPQPLSRIIPAGGPRTLPITFPYPLLRTPQPFHSLEQAAAPGVRSIIAPAHRPWVWPDPFSCVDALATPLLAQNGEKARRGQIRNRSQVRAVARILEE